MIAWRRWALIVGGLFAVGGLLVWKIGGGPVLLILGAVAIVTGLLEPIYGRAIGRAPQGNWRPTGEKFVDPETGELVTVWYDPVTGERRYVSEAK
jgi:hypothetical protein